MKFFKGIFFASLLPAFVLTVSPVLAAPVTWSMAMDITGDADVLVSGSLVGAYNVGDGGVPAATVNGVTFAPFALNSSGGPVSSGTAGDFTLATADIFASSNTAYGSTAAPFTSQSAAYQALLASATITSAPATFTLTITGLNVGNDYQFQWFANTSGAGSQSHRVTSGNGRTILDNASGADGDLGQFAVGSFVADASSQVFTFSSVPPLFGFAQLNAFQLRDLTPIPEPASALLSFVGMGMVACRRTRPKAS